MDLEAQVAARLNRILRVLDVADALEYDNPTPRLLNIQRKYTDGGTDESEDTHTQRSET